MWLRNKDHFVLASPQGGSIIQWQWQERTILGPARMISVNGTLKRRGESHWCLPNFGTPPEHLKHLGKHGWLRNTLMRANTDSMEACFEKDRHLYDVLTTVMVRENGFRATLKVENKQEKEKIPILPAFHPYFAAPPTGLQMCIGGKHFNQADFRGTAAVYERNDPISINLIGVGTVTMKPTHNCTHVVLWSDKSYEYVCVEPIFGKPGTFGTPEGNWLNPGETFRCGVQFEFVPA